MCVWYPLVTKLNVPVTKYIDLNIKVQIYIYIYR